jgi:hypothetical protein
MADFRDEGDRDRYQDARWSPWPEHAGPGQPPPSILGWVEPDLKGVALAKEVWREIGYNG